MKLAHIFNRCRILPLFGVLVSPLVAHAQPGAIRDALTLHASFDRGINADFAKGDPVLYTAKSTKREYPTTGLPPEIVIAKGKGKRGDALHFTKRSSATLFYRAAKNVAYSSKDWSGTISFWISIDPEKTLTLGYADPIQITERAWNDAAFWVDFSDKLPRHFRLGAFADLKVWNPTNKDFEKMTPAERPMFDAGKPPFADDKWSHVAITFEHFNTGGKDGVATLYIDGKRQGTVEGRTQTYTWDIEKTAVMLGLSFNGFLDELSIFDRALTPAEIKRLQEGEKLLPDSTSKAR